MSNNVRNTKRKRFSDDQIKSLESIYESESRPELRHKQHLATGLGLQPRQVAIWFQNKRARSKSKQIERDYGLLKSNYDKLASQFEALKKENQILLIQVQRFRKMADRKRDGEEHESKNQTILAKWDNPRFVKDITRHELNVLLRNEMNQEADCLGLELEVEADVMNTIPFAEVSLTSLEEGCSLESCNFLDNTGSDSNWWDF